MRSVRFLLASVTIALMNGCANLPRPDQPRDVTELLAEFHRRGFLTAEEQRREINIAQAAFERTPNDTTRLNLALALLSPHGTWRDDSRVQSLLNEIEATPEEPGAAWHGLAQLLELLVDRQRELRDSRRKLDQLVRRLREEQRKTDAMQHKIESLRAIDRDMMLQRKGR